MKVCGCRSVGEGEGIFEKFPVAVWWEWGEGTSEKFPAAVQREGLEERKFKKHSRCRFAEEFSGLFRKLRQTAPRRGSLKTAPDQGGNRTERTGRLLPVVLWKKGGQKTADPEKS